ncbi:peptidylprolyl isomerase [Geodermatophilus sp. YIM 151500]|uniref:peptidylprolyl isomerase n=1 Tax=Geodermatophilus sp. YIM 151500 TaxID=2984531 RepID=UPI0021E48616|nr:peptidylprolyl isomerase [Geodermatophilus sp. YIM 151500]MCV2489562.1 peptidylprolyl isomerase [Geodermatophilus sp. YIM 151500]
MLNRRLTAVAAVGVALVGLTGCRTSPSVAAYVGDEQVSVAELEAAVDRRLDDPALAAFAQGQPDVYTRQVLTTLVQDAVHEAAAARYGVRVTDDDVRTRIDALLGDDDPEQVFAQLAGQGLGYADVFASVRQQLVRQRIAESEGLAEGLAPEDLQARYEQVRDQFTELDFGFITVPDQATADAVLAQLTANPGGYPSVAAQYGGPYTLAQTEQRPPAELPAPLRQQAAAAAPGTGFSVAVPETGGIVVGFVADRTTPSFEELRPRLEQEALAAADEQVQELVGEVRADLDVTVNPRYGRLEEGVVAPGRGGPVDILDAES